MVDPVPVLPAKSVTPVLFNTIIFVEAVAFPFGVKVAFQVMAPSAELTALNVPLATVRSALLKPVTASEKVIVTRLVSPILNAVSVTTIVAVGLCVSIE